ncbi:hypothetical protein GPECTOR_115g338 [Gonium pectorale]|uniref:Guanylate cyclase domain-containing protein n=1 Tax=Gonium pectorale TaxID=33097 RepID=A0A150FZ15_GONPE|nr:hypothetical protein GPECTOR_115g338 [Gonium pectorale]|eukprot:KXZ42844.1 hypothetical protein GPECTOR_115g338 [Gonium pectorale]
MVTLEWDAVFVSLFASPTLLQEGVEVSVAPLPGSRRVMDRRPDSPTAGALVDCSWELCGVSANHDLLYLGKLPGATNMTPEAPSAGSSVLDTPGGGCTIQSTIALEAAAVSEVLGAGGKQQPLPTPVNRAPYSVFFSGMYQATITDPREARAVALQADEFTRRFANIVTPKATAFVVARMALGYPYTAAANTTEEAAQAALLYGRMRWWTALSTPYMDDQYAAQGCSRNATQALLRSLWHGVHSPNAATDISSPFLVNYGKWGLSHAALMLEPWQGRSVDEAVGTLAGVMEMVADAYTPTLLRNAYSDYVNADWDAHTSGLRDKGQAPSPTSGLSNAALAALLVSLLVAVGLSVTALTLLLLRLRRGHRDLLGRVKAPRAGPDTTLLVSDVQNSTRLWEELPASVMDTALKIHHATFRRVMARHDGYESATGGPRCRGVRALNEGGVAGVDVRK